MPHDALEAISPDTWARFAAAALEAIVATQKTSDLHVEDFRERHADAAAEAAAYADALSREYAARFITTAGSKEPR